MYFDNWHFLFLKYAESNEIVCCKVRNMNTIFVWKISTWDGWFTKFIYLYMGEFCLCSFQLSPSLVKLRLKSVSRFPQSTDHSLFLLPSQPLQLRHLVGSKQGSFRMSSHQVREIVSKKILWVYGYMECGNPKNIPKQVENPHLWNVKNCFVPWGDNV